MRHDITVQEDIRGITVEYVAETHVTCDKCNKTFIEDNHNFFQARFHYIKGRYDPQEQLTTGSVIALDLCPDCTPDFLTLLNNYNYKLHKLPYENPL